MHAITSSFCECKRLNKSNTLLLEAPNSLSLFWILICLKTIITPDPAVRNVFDYCIYLFSIVLAIVGLIWQKKKSYIVSITICFGLLLFISALGIVQNISITALTSTIGIICVGCLILSIVLCSNKIQSFYIKPIYYLTLLSLLFRTIKGEYLGNTTSGVICFLSFGLLICVIDGWNKTKRKRIWISRFVDIVSVVVSFGVMFYVGLRSASRTPLFTTIIIFAFYFLLHFFHMSYRKYTKLFWITCFTSFIILVVYINIHSFSWYQSLNEYSVNIFDKNLDSSRPALWREEINSLLWWQFLFGKGTGVLPTYKGYQSFHNSYIQLLIQNGIISLVVLVIVFKIIWSQIVKNSKDEFTKMLVSIFIGVLIYNLFECTLLQNKVFLGQIEWTILSMSIIFSKKRILLFSKV